MHRAKRLTDLLESIDFAADAALGEILVTGICEDSRRVEPGNLFVAISGTAQDGAGFAAAAVSRGAIAVIAERRLALRVPCIVVSDARRVLAELAAGFFDAPTRELHTVGVTGTNGKTTVCHWVAHLLGAGETELISTVANEDRGLPAITTPPSPVVQRIAREAVDGGKMNLVIEASSVGIEQRRLDGIAFGVAAFTNLSCDHLDLHGDVMTYLAAKAGLFQRLGPNGWGVVNVGDPHADAILAATVGRTFSVGLDCEADLAASGVEESSGGTTFRLDLAGDVVSVTLPASGLHNVENALVAAGVAVCSGRGLAEVAERLRTVPAIPGRWAVLQDARGTTAVVDFAHNPDALCRVLEVLRGTYDRIVAVFGCPGGTDREKRFAMGEVSGRLADLTILTSDNPKDEDPEAIVDEIACGVRRSGGRLESTVDRAEAVRRGVDEAGSSGVLLVAGKGHERYQIVRGEFIPYSDASVLAARGFAPIEPPASA